MLHVQAIHHHHFFSVHEHLRHRDSRVCTLKGVGLRIDKGVKTLGLTGTAFWATTVFLGGEVHPEEVMGVSWGTGATDGSLWFLYA